ncbi:hypothetical protein D3C72_2202630 [compost metagenome]
MSLVPGQFDFCAALDISQVDQGKIVELQAMSFFEPKHFLIELHGLVEVAHANHGVNKFCHSIYLHFFVILGFCVKHI